MPDGSFKELSLSQFKGKYVILVRRPPTQKRSFARLDVVWAILSSNAPFLDTKQVMYPLDWTFVCPSELIAFSDRIQEFKVRSMKAALNNNNTRAVELATTRSIDRSKRHAKPHHAHPPSSLID